MARKRKNYSQSHISATKRASAAKEEKVKQAEDISNNQATTSHDTTESTNLVPVKKTPSNVALQIHKLEGQSLTRVSKEQAKIQFTNCIPASLVQYPHIESKVQSPMILCMDWHPRIMDLLLVGGKYGDIYLFKGFDETEKSWDKALHKELYKDAGITNIKFDHNYPNLFYSSSAHGDISKHDIFTRHVVTLLETYWFSVKTRFTALGFNCDRKSLLVGDNIGILYQIPDNDGDHTKIRIHKSKIHSIDMHPINPNIFATSSLDKTVNIWDIRAMRAKKPLENIVVGKALHSATFSRTNGGTLAVNDQEDTIFIYSTANWKLERTIEHHHHKLQKIAPIRATWHPSADIITIGRFNPTDDSNSYQIDFINAHTGELMFELNHCLGVKAINSFNNAGDTLASCSKANVLIWKQKSFWEGMCERLVKALITHA